MSAAFRLGGTGASEQIGCLAWRCKGHPLEARAAMPLRLQAKKARVARARQV